jgi:chromosome segregation ATPase
MLRYLIPAVVMVGAVVVLLAGALGNLNSLPELTTAFRGSVAEVIAGNTQTPSQNSLSNAPAPGAVTVTETAQPAVDALKSQLVQIQQQVDQGRTELAAVHAQQDVEQHKLAAIQQQRQAAASAVSQLQSQSQSLADQTREARASASSQPPAASAQQQAANAALQKQSADLQAQIKQQSDQLTALHANEDVEQRKITAVQQQRQAAESAISQLQSQSQSLAERAQEARASASNQASAVSAQQQAANAALQKQFADLQAQVKQQSDQLAALRANEDRERQALETLHQQRQAEEGAVASLKSQKEQLAAAQPPAPQPRPEAKQPAPSSRTAAATNSTMDDAVAELRAKQRQPVQPPARKAEPVSGVPTYSPGQPTLIVSTKGVLITARELLASGRASEARQLLTRAQAQSALHPVSPNQPYATGGNMVASQIGNAIHFIDSGNSWQAMEAINVAMDNVNTGWSSGSGYPQAPAPGSYASDNTYR